MSEFVLDFGEEGAVKRGAVGGKAVNLARLASAGFPVPAGFIVTTDSYLLFIAENGLKEEISRLLQNLTHSDPEDVEAVTAEIRKLITAADLPKPVSDAISRQYALFGHETFVAVRSSGTAEDLEGASFAGQHDTYLDIRGEAAVLHAVKECWASLWTARAVAYRQRTGYDQGEISIAVVVQTMVESQVSGVMFTANPMTARVDEFVVNASWGLGEAIVAGIVTPDLFVLDRETLRIKKTSIGSKAVRIVRAGEQAGGTRQEDVLPDDRVRACLSDDRISELGALGTRVMEHYEGYPQDIEWAFADGHFYLLQSRDVTGVEFSWDEDLDNFQTIPQDDETVWTRSWSDGVWTGAITPLMYSFRCENSQLNRVHFSKIWGIDWGAERRVYKYHRGFVYYNSKSDYTAIPAMLHPAMRREELFEHLPPAWRKTALKEPFSWMQFAAMWARIGLFDSRHLPWECWKHNYALIEDDSESAHGLPVDHIRRMGDRALVKYTKARMLAEPQYFQHFLDLFYLHVPIAMGIFHYMVETWLGRDASFVTELLTGSPYQSITVKENLRLQELALEVSNSPVLRELFDNHPGAAFFEEARKVSQAQSFNEMYRRFISDFGHRGHADRDLWFDRRAENPDIDYTAIGSMLDVDFSAAEEKAKAVVRHREGLTNEVTASLKKMPFGDLRAQAFVIVQDWLLQFWAFRDDERAHSDKITFSIKKAVQEIGRRLYERKLVEGPEDFYFFSKEELFELFLSGCSTRLTRAKATARRRNFDRFKKDFFAPMYMVGDQYADLDEKQISDDPNILKGVGTSRGKVTGTARIIASQKDIGRVKKNEILVTAATDPGWTPVFMVISGLVLETGGMLAHGSLISREYGIPAVQIVDAMKKIPDGAQITVNGDTGEVHINDEHEALAAE